MSAYKDNEESQRHLSERGINKVKYLYPCKPNWIWPGEYLDRLDNDPQWVAEVKRNGWRCLVEKDYDGVLRLWTRHKTLIPDALAALRAALADLVPMGTELDGELIDKRTKNIKGQLVLFDIIYYRGQLVTDSPLYKRRLILESIVPNNAETQRKGIHLPTWHITGKKELYAETIKNGDEGIVIKKLDSKYITGATNCPQNPMWLKLKARGR